MVKSSQRISFSFYISRKKLLSFHLLFARKFIEKFLGEAPVEPLVHVYSFKNSSHIAAYPTVSIAHPDMQEGITHIRIISFDDSPPHPAIRSTFSNNSDEARIQYWRGERIV